MSVERESHNDSVVSTSGAAYSYFPPVPESGEQGYLVEGRLREIHLYSGSNCNRACSFCCVGGSTEGWYRPHSKALLDWALELVWRDGMVKFYGGEPTLHPENLKAAIEHLNAGGFRGQYRIFSNGLLADVLIGLLDVEPRLDVVLNYSILHGRGAPPIPRAALKKLLEAGSSRIFASHSEIEDTGIPHEAIVKEADRPDFSQSCPQCLPVLRSDGVFHACPFAVELMDERFVLGQVGDDAGTMLDRFAQVRRWQVDVVNVEGRRRNLSPCQVCRYHLSSLSNPYRKD